jgi:hypothetical protein
MSKTLDRISKLLAKAESTDSEAEREALMSKAQQIATLAAIDLEVARQHQVTKELREQPTQKRVVLFEGPDKRKQGRHHFVNLFTSIGRANDLTCNIYHDSTGVIPFGFPSDIDVTEALYGSLAVQMVAAADAYIKTGAYKTETVYRAKRVKDDYWGGTQEVWDYFPIDARQARSSFYEGFISTITTRLFEAKREAEKVEVEVTDAETGETTSTSGELVLVGKREQVRDYYKANSTARGSWRGGSSSARSSGANTAGRSAGQSARLGGGASIGGSRKAVNA